MPQAYMRGFCETPNTLFVKDINSGRVRRSSTRGIGYLENFYTVDTVDEKDSPEVEEALSKIENICIPLLSKLSQGIELSNSEFADIAIYIAVQYGRTPHAKARMDKVATIIATNEMKQRMADTVNDPKLFDEMIEELKKANPSAELPTREKIIEWVLKPDPLLKVKIDSGTHVKHFFDQAEVIGSGLLKHKWVVLHAPASSSFIFSDNPIGLEISRKLEEHEILAILLPGVERIFPLNAKTCLVITPHKFERAIEHRKLTANETRRINKLIHSQTRRYSISGNEALIRSL